MASFWFLSLLFIIVFMASFPSPSLASSSSELISSSSAIPTAINIPASPAGFPTDFPPYQVLSPDIAPLLPSPGGVVPTTGSTIPTIPSSPSPPNPDSFNDDSLGPDSAPSPFASLPDSLGVKRYVVGFLNLAVVAGWVTCWSLQLFLLGNEQCYYSR